MKETETGEKFEDNACRGIALMRRSRVKSDDLAPFGRNCEEHNAHRQDPEFPVHHEGYRTFQCHEG